VGITGKSMLILCIANGVSIESTDLTMCLASQTARPSHPEFVMPGGP
jgi:hypothetical protein